MQSSTILRHSKPTAIIHIDSNQIEISVGILNIHSNLEILYHTSLDSKGTRHGSIYDMPLFGTVMSQALEVVEKEVGTKIDNVLISLARSFISIKTIELKVNMNGITIQQTHIDEFYRSISQNSSGDNEIIEINSTYYHVDDNEFIFNPLYMVCHNFIGYYSITSISRSFYNNILSILSRCHLNLLGFVNYSRSAIELLSNYDYIYEDSYILEFGYDFTAIYRLYSGKIFDSFIIHEGKRDVVLSISSEFNLNTNISEKILDQYVTALPDEIAYDETISVGSVYISKISLAKITKKKTLSILNNLLAESDFDNSFCISKHVVLQGYVNNILGIDKEISHIISKNLLYTNYQDLDNSFNQFEDITNEDHVVGCAKNYTSTKLYILFFDNVLGGDIDPLLYKSKSNTAIYYTYKNVDNIYSDSVQKFSILKALNNLFR